MFGLYAESCFTDKLKTAITSPRFQLGTSQVKVQQHCYTNLPCVYAYIYLASWDDDMKSV